MKVWSEFHPFVLPDVIGCPDPVMDHALIQASREFCEKTLAWDVWLDGVSTSEGNSQYDFERDLRDEVVKLLDATIDGHPLPILSANDLPSDWMTRSTGRRGVFTQDRRTFYVLPLPGDAAVIKTRVALKPGLTSGGVSDELFAQFADEIANGAKARLMVSPNKDYSNPVLGQTLRTTFEINCAAIAYRVSKSYSRAPRRTVAHFF